MSVKISRLLTEYFNLEVKNPILNVSMRDTPAIQPTKITWEIHKDPERFSKRFKFNSRKRMISFVNEILSYEDKVMHHGEIRIDHLDVIISVYTHNINRITELDKEYILQADNIHRDVLDFEY